MQATIYDLPRAARIRRLSAAAKEVLQQCDIQPVKTRFLSSAFPVFRVWGRPAKGGATRQYMLKFSEGMNAGFDGVDRPLSELDTHGTDFRLQALWLEALATQTDLGVQRPLRNTAGQVVGRAAIEGLSAPVEYFLSTWIPGRICSDGWNANRWPGPGVIRQVGRIAATLHKHAQGWRLPRGYRRPREGWQQTMTRNYQVIAASPFVKSVPKEDMAALEQGLQAALRVLDGLGTGREHFGLIHNDLCPQNLLVHQRRVAPIDFGNAVFGYYLWDTVYPLGAPQFNQDAFRPRHRAYIEGYREVRPLPPDYERIIQALFVVWGLVGTFSALNYSAAAKFVPEVKIPRAVWVAQRFVQGVKFLDI